MVTIYTKFEVGGTRALDPKIRGAWGNGIPLSFCCTQPIVTGAKGCKQLSESHITQPRPDCHLLIAIPTPNPLRQYATAKQTEHS